MQFARHIYAGGYASNVKICIQVFLVTLFIAVSSYEVYILTQLSSIYIWDDLHICGI